jgi:glutamyl-tRNA reductase
MNVLAIGMSHRTAGVRELERTAISVADTGKVLDELLHCPQVSEALLLSTCNRVEIYAIVETFHGGLSDLTGVLARHAGVEPGQLSSGIHVHYSAGAVEHLFAVAAGLDSMVVGDAQILGQLRSAYATADKAGTVGRALHELVQHALRVGKRVHAETDIDHVAASVVGVAVADADEVLGGLAGRHALVVGAGSMGALAAATARRRGVGEIVVTNRTGAHAQRMAASVEGRAVAMDDVSALRAEIAAADVLVSCTGATGLVLDATDFGPRGGRDLVVLDLALPRDVNPSVAGLDGVRYVDLDVLREAGAMVSDSDVADATAIVTDRLARYLDEQQQLAVAPTVTALRARASAVIESELRRLDGRLPDLDTGARAEVATAVRRAVEKVLHAPTVRVKELAATPDGDRYAAALRALFDLDPASPETVVAIRAQSAAGTRDTDSRTGETR